jgi:quercetin dioxygenase-like cupin family protein
MDIFHVEFLQRPAQTSNQFAEPAAAENASARVYNWLIAAGASTPTHSHKNPYLVVAATAMPLKMTAPDGQSRSEEVKAGDFHWIESKTTHVLTNEGVAQGQIVEIERK